MSNGLIILSIVIAVALILAYVAAVVLRKRNETLLDNLEERKEKLYNLPVNDEVEAIKNMHLIGQSQVTFREWNQKWVDLSLNSITIPSVLSKLSMQLIISKARLTWSKKILLRFVMP